MIKILEESLKRYKSLEDITEACDAIYFITSPVLRYDYLKYSLNKGRHILCESPICISSAEWKELKNLANKNRCILMDAIRTA